MQQDHRYDDIIHLRRPDSPGHPRMPMIERAAQFSPFAALTGYEDAIEEEARLTEEKIDPGEERLSALNERLSLLRQRAGERPAIRVVRFQKDEKKAGGAYGSVQGRLKKIDGTAQRLILEDGTTVPFDDIWELEIDESSE